VTSLLAIPLGVGLYLLLCRIASGTTEDAVVASWWSLALIPVGTVLIVVASTSLAARLATRIRAAHVLRYE
jgi:ABC-type antimicrobial peptide transport system permease subunit